MAKTWGGNDPKDFGTDHAQQPVNRPMSNREYVQATNRAGGKKKYKGGILNYFLYEMKTKKREPKNKGKGKN